MAKREFCLIPRFCRFSFFSRVVFSKTSPSLSNALALCVAARCEYLSCVISIFRWPSISFTVGKSTSRARAIENQVYVIAPDQSGKSVNSFETHGHSVIVDPWGKTIAELPALKYRRLE